MRKVICSWLLLFLLAAPPLAGAFNDRLVDRICITDLQASATLEKRKPIPVGCELVDCCPGCPGPGPIEWRVAIDAKILAGAELRFEGLSPAELKRLKIEGNARRDGDRIVLRPGPSRIRGLPFKTEAQVPVGLLRPLARKKPAAGAVPARGTVTERLSVRQFLGQFLVNKFDWTFLVRRCGPIIDPPFFDKLRIQGIAAGDDVVVMLDARTQAQCSDGTPPAPEWIFRSTGETPLPNLLAPASSCNSEIAIFSKKHAMKWETGVVWGNSPGDVHTVTLDPVIDVPVHIWVANQNPGVAALASAHMDRAINLYQDNMVGVRFVPTVSVLPADAEATVNAGIGIASNGDLVCQSLGPIQASTFYGAGALNVYYVNEGFTGRNCAIMQTPHSCPGSAFAAGDANISFIGTTANDTTLAHELGHAFGLRPAICGGHADSSSGILGHDNLMWTGSSDPRSTFSLGQVFRMNTHSDKWGGTMLIQNGQRPGPGRHCAPDESTNICPRLDAVSP
jgi:hypothetical protein